MMPRPSASVTGAVCRPHHYYNSHGVVKSHGDRHTLRCPMASQNLLNLFHNCQYCPRLGNWNALHIYTAVNYMALPTKLEQNDRQTEKQSELDPTLLPTAELAAEFYSPKICRKNTNIHIIKWNQHCNKWLACYLKWIIVVISKLLVITDGRRFCNIKETDNNHSRWQPFQFRFNSSAEVVCYQLNFNRNIFVFSRILAEFFSSGHNSANSNISRIFSPAICIFSDCRLGVWCKKNTRLAQL